MTKDTISLLLPYELLEALDRRAAALGLMRDQLIVWALDQYSAWSPAFLKAIETRRPELDEAAEEMMSAIRARPSQGPVGG